jgi:hypothetical protein
MVDLLAHCKNMLKKKARRSCLLTLFHSHKLCGRQMSSSAAISVTDTRAVPENQEVFA